MHLVGNVCGEEPLVGCDQHAYTSSETSVSTHKLEQTIEKACSYFLAHTLKVCKGTPSDQRGIQVQSIIVTYGEYVQSLSSENCLDSHAHDHERDGSSHD
jgi:hypothetical protein